MEQKKTLANWIRWYREAEKQPAAPQEHVACFEDEDHSELVTVVVPYGSPQTDLQNDLKALSGVRWVFEWTVVPGPETIQ